MVGVSWLSEKPISFKINRKSEADSIVKSSISSKLLDFLSDYSDDVLAVRSCSFDFSTKIGFLQSNRLLFLNRFVCSNNKRTGIHNGAGLQWKASVSGER